MVFTCAFVFQIIKVESLTSGEYSCSTENTDKISNLQLVPKALTSIYNI